jgi:hypothetical protein
MTESDIVLKQNGEMKSVEEHGQFVATCSRDLFMTPEEKSRLTQQLNSATCPIKGRVLLDERGDCLNIGCENHLPRPRLMQIKADAVSV